MTGSAEPQSAESDQTTDDGQVYRRGYARYTGAREGRTRSYLAVISHSVRRALGIRRKWTAKVIPIILYVAAFIPVVGFISIPAIFGADLLQVQPVELFSAISLILLVFAAAASPEMLCDDRRENVLPLYYSRGLSRHDYLFAKLIALGGLMMTIAFLPAMILFLGNTFLQDQPFRYFAENIDQILRIIGTALLVSVFYASVGLAISAMTMRKGVASAIYIGFFLAGGAISNALFEAIGDPWNAVFALAGPLDIPDAVLMLLFDYEATGSLPARSGVDLGWYLVSVAAFASVSAVILYRRYLRED